MCPSLEGGAKALRGGGAPGLLSVPAAAFSLPDLCGEGGLLEPSLDLPSVSCRATQLLVKQEEASEAKAMTCLSNPTWGIMPYHQHMTLAFHAAKRC